MSGVLRWEGYWTSLVLPPQAFFVIPLSLVFPEDSHTFCSQSGFSLAVGNQTFLPNASSQSSCRCPQIPGDQHFPRQRSRYQGLHVRWDVACSIHSSQCKEVRSVGEMLSVCVSVSLSPPPFLLLSIPLCSPDARWRQPTSGSPERPVPTDAL